MCQLRSRTRWFGGDRERPTSGGSRNRHEDCYGDFSRFAVIAVASRVGNREGRSELALVVLQSE